MTARPFEVTTSRGAFATVWAPTEEAARAYARLMTGSKTATAIDRTGLPEDVELIYAGYSNEAKPYRRREWLLRVEGVEVHVYEEQDPEIRFRACIPGVGTGGYTIKTALYYMDEFLQRQARARQAGQTHESANWFTDDILSGKRPYFPTSYKPEAAK